MQKQIRQTKRLIRTRKRMPTSKQSIVAAMSMSTRTTVSASTASSPSLPTIATSAPSKPTTTATTSTAQSATADRQQYFAGLQELLTTCSTFAAMKLAIPVSLPYPLQVISPSDTDLHLLSDGTISTALLANIVTNEDTSSLRPVCVEADGNCFARKGVCPSRVAKRATLRCA